MFNLDKSLRLLTAGAALSALMVGSLPASGWEEEKKPTPTKEAPQDSADDAKDADDDSADESGDDKDGKDKKKDKTIADLTEDHTMIDGLFKIYQDPKTGAMTMEVKEDQLDKEFIYTSHVVDGVVEGGHFRGQYRRDKVLKFKKHFNKIELVEVNASFYFDEDAAIARAKDANISDAVLSTDKIKAKSDDGKTYLIDASKLFKSAALDPVKPTPNPRRKPWEQFNLGKMSSGKTKVSAIKNYPENTSVTVDYVFTNPAPLNGGRGSEITDPRNVTVKIQHTLLNMPENNFKPRLDDPRVGYFLSYVENLTDRSATPWRDMITRWDLQKKDPSAAVSEVVEPIVWWIENTTPVAHRDTIKAAVESWNSAFEAAGLKNAIVVKIQPDDADWDSDDIRYNVLRWTSSPQPPFGGYGPSFINPRTGQIMGADIMLEYSFLTNRINQSNIFDKQLLEVGTENEDAYVSKLGEHAKYCNLANHLQLNNLVGNALAMTTGASEDEKRKIVEESIYYLLLHEVGHTLGLNHNMKATQARSYETTHDISAQDDGLAGSVMDYPSINFAPEGKDQAHYYTVKPGPYDIWAIQFGYNPDLDDQAKRMAHLNRSTEKGLQFGNDADDMRAPGRGIDPRINIYDMTDDAIAFARDRLGLAQKSLGELKDRHIDKGDTYQALRNAYLILTGDMAWQGRVVSRYVAGVYVDRANAGQDGATAPYRPVEEDRQKEAMKLLRDHIFSPNAFAADSGLISHLAITRRGFAHYGGTEDPKVHGRAFAIQSDILSHLLHPATLSRLTDSSLYGNSYSAVEMVSDLTDAIFEDDLRSNVNGFRQNLQIHYVLQLIDILSSKKHDYVARSAALASTRSIRKKLDRTRSGDMATRAHRDHIKLLIDKALEVSGS